jgi:hypothetical protein
MVQRLFAVSDIRQIVGYRTPVFIQRFPWRLHIAITYNLPHLHSHLKGNECFHIFSIFYTHHRVPNEHMMTINFDTITNNYMKL